MSFFVLGLVMPALLGGLVMMLWPKVSPLDGHGYRFDLLVTTLHGWTEDVSHTLVWIGTFGVELKVDGMSFPFC